MKALTIHQPYAHLIMLGLKHFETRSWATKYRGTLAIHAGVKWNGNLERLAIEYGDLAGIDLLQNLVFGAVLGTVELVACIKTEAVFGKRGRPDPFELHVGNFAPGRYAWKVESPIIFPEPIYCTGAQNLWEVK